MLATNTPSHATLAIPTEVLAEKLARAHVLLPRQALRGKYERALDKRKVSDAGDEGESPTRRQRPKQRAMSAAEHYSAANWIVGCPSYGAASCRDAWLGWARVAGLL